jgi:hypothetical protein
MWKALRDLLTRASEDLGVELPGLPDLGAVGDTVTGAAEALTGQADQVAADLAGTATDATAGLPETATGVAEQAGQVTGDLAGAATDAATAVQDGVTGAAEQAATATAEVGSRLRG